MGFVEIGKVLRQEIIQGVMKPGDRLPTERELSERFETTRITVRRALRLLDDEQLIRRLQGSGTYVRPRPERMVPVQNNSSRSYFEHAPSLERAVTAFEVREAEDWLAGDTRIRAHSKYLHVEYVLDLRGKRMGHGQLALLYPYAESASREDAARVDFIERWSKKGQFNIQSCEHFVAALDESDDVISRSKFGIQLPALKSVVRYKMANNHAVAVEILHYDGKMVMVKTNYPFESTQLSEKL